MKKIFFIVFTLFLMCGCQGKDMKSVGEFNFKLEAPNGQWGVSIIELDKEGKFKDSTNGIVSRETLKSDKPTITLKWNGQSEEIILKNIE